LPIGAKIKVTKFQEIVNNEIGERVSPQLLVDNHPCHAEKHLVPAEYCAGLKQDSSGMTFLSTRN
jgi:hypothetical protein